jgi:hypothetical protein
MLQQINKIDLLNYLEKDNYYSLIILENNYQIDLTKSFNCEDEIFSYHDMFSYCKNYDYVRDINCNIFLFYTNTNNRSKCIYTIFYKYDDVFLINFIQTSAYEFLENYDEEKLLKIVEEQHIVMIRKNKFKELRNNI